MKKLVMLSVIGIMSLSSFGTKEVKKDVVKYRYFVVHCSWGDGHFACDGCTNAQAQAMGNALCAG